MRSISFVDPFRCRIWSLHDRFEGEISEESCQTEIESFRRHGQLVPVLGRPLRGDPLYDVELIYGARRLFVARHLNKPLAVELRELTDREAIIAMDIENRQRVDISPYERGMSYARWLRGGYFDSQDDIVKALNVSASQVSRLLKLAKLPSVIVNAFENTVDICERWGLDLVEAWEDPQRKQLVAQRARAIAQMSPRPAARDVYRRLLAAAARRRRYKQVTHDEVVSEAYGDPLFRVRHQSKFIALVLPTELVSPDTLEEIRQGVTEILHDAAVQRIESARRGARRASHSGCPLTAL